MWLGYLTKLRELAAKEQTPSQLIDRRAFAVAKQGAYQM